MPQPISSRPDERMVVAGREMFGPPDQPI